MSSRRNLPPGFIVPCSPELRDRPPSGPGWIHEIKYDGWRLIARRDGEHVRLWSRPAQDWTARFRRIAAAVASLPAVSVTLDGEAVSAGPDGRPDFHALRSQEGQFGAVLVAFDVLQLDGRDLRDLALEERRAALGGLLKPAPDGIVMSEAIEGEGETVFRHACALGLEGIVSKRLGSRYRSGPTDNWRKVRCPAYERK